MFHCVINRILSFMTQNHFRTRLRSKNCELFVYRIHMADILSCGIIYHQATYSFIAVISHSKIRVHISTESKNDFRYVSEFKNTCKFADVQSVNLSICQLRITYLSKMYSLIKPPSSIRSVE